jgi:prephenate dehydrogenase
VGLGLIGGSIAARVRTVWPGITCVGVDVPRVSAEARRRGLIDEARDSVSDLGNCGLVVLATPVPAIIELLSTSAATFAGCVVTDTGSTKRAIVDAGRGVPGFVGGHPIAGTEAGGIENAHSSLVVNRRWVVTPGRDPRANRVVERFVEGLGAIPVRMSPDEHDRAMAVVSHLPQLLSVALMNCARDAGVLDANVAGGGFEDMTRLAGSPGGLWDGIVDSNTDEIEAAIASFRRHLEDVATPGRLRASFARANESRSRLQDARKERT